MKPNTSLQSPGNSVEIYDTTLRDGSQGQGIKFSAGDKLRIADRLDAFGVQYIEGGWPGSNPKDMAFFASAKRRAWNNAKLVAFGMTRRQGMRAEKDPLILQLLECEAPAVAIVGKSSLFHVRNVLRVTPGENLRMIAETIRFFKAQGRFVIYDAEHAFDAEEEYALRTWAEAEEAGADCVCLCDTNGASLPEKVRRITARARGNLSCRLGIHTHNDRGLAIANALAAIEAGATQVQGTINGYGERIGNCNLTSFIPLLEFSLHRPSVPAESLQELKKLSHFVDTIANVAPDPRQPWVGECAFAHKGGMHAHAVGRIARSYEHIDPEAVGNHRRILMSDMAGRSSALLKAKEFGIQLTLEVATAVAKRVKRLEHQGYEFEAADGSFALLMMGCDGYRPPFVVEDHHVHNHKNGRTSTCEATVKVRVRGRYAHTAGNGDGPVNALDIALRKALTEFFPVLKRVNLLDYKVRILGGKGTGARTQVWILSGNGVREWGTVGVSANIIIASLQALTDSMKYALVVA